MGKNLYIVGSGGLAKEVLNIFLRSDNIFGYNFCGYLDEDRNKCDEKTIFYLPEKTLTSEDAVFIAIGDPYIKQRLRDLSNLSQAYFPILIDNKASISIDSYADWGSIIFPYVVCTANNKIGKHVTIYQHCSISHDTIIGDYCNITPGVQIAGRCKIGNFVYLGIGCAISNDVTICDDVIVGAGTVVVDNITESGTYVGVPARKIK